MESLNAMNAIGKTQPTASTETKAYEENLLKKEGTPDTVELSTNTEKNVEKPGFWKSFGQGILANIKFMIPFYNAYTIGKERTEQQNAIKDLKNIEDGKECDTKKPGIIKSTLKGIGLSIAYSIPVLGSYLIGKEQIEQDNAIKELNGEETKAPGFLRSLGKGIATKIAVAVPFLGTYVIGKEFAEQDKLVDKVEEMKNAAGNEVEE